MRGESDSPPPCRVVLPHRAAVRSLGWQGAVGTQDGAARRGGGDQSLRPPTATPPTPPEGTLVVARWTESRVGKPATVQERPGVAPSGESSGVSRWLSCSTPSVALDPLSPVFTPLPPRALTCGPCGRGSHLLPCGQATPAGAPRAAGGERGWVIPAGCARGRNSGQQPRATEPVSPAISPDLAALSLPCLSGPGKQLPGAPLWFPNFSAGSSERSPFCHMSCVFL